MAVTQQLARISSHRAASASESSTALEAILSFHVTGDDAFVDLDWAPQILRWSLQAINEHGMAATVDQAFEGAEVLNSACPVGVPQYIVYSEVRAHQPDRVQEIAAQLQRLPIEAMEQTYAVVRSAHPDGELPDDFLGYIRRHNTVLVQFYEEASKNNQAVITWWD